MWAKTNNWNELKVGLKSRILTRLGLIEGRIIRMSKENDDQYVTVELVDPPGSIFTINRLKWLEIWKGEGAIIEELKPAEPAEETRAAEPEPKIEEVKKKVARVKLKKEIEAEDNTDGGDQYYMTMNTLSRSSGVSNVTLKKYLERHADKIPHTVVKGRPMFSKEAIDVVQAIKNKNVEAHCEPKD